LLYLDNAMVDQPIGLAKTEDGIWAIYFGAVLLATFDVRDHTIRGRARVLPILPDTFVTHHPGCSA